jgi:hypothetical protein
MLSPSTRLSETHPHYSTHGLASFPRPNTTSASSSIQHGKAQQTTWPRSRRKNCGNKRRKRAERQRKRSGKKSFGGAARRRNSGGSCPRRVLLGEHVGVLPAFEQLEDGAGWLHCRRESPAAQDIALLRLLRVAAAPRVPLVEGGGLERLRVVMAAQSSCAGLTPFRFLACRCRYYYVDTLNC